MYVLKDSTFTSIEIHTWTLRIESSVVGHEGLSTELTQRMSSLLNIEYCLLDLLTSAQSKQLVQHRRRVAFCTENDQKRTRAGSQKSRSTAATAKLRTQSSSAASLLKQEN